MEGYTPQPAAIRAAMTRLERVTEGQEPIKVYMGAPLVTRDEAGQCNTVACVAGWYLLACVSEARESADGIKWEWYESEAEGLFRSGVSVDWTEGAAMLATDLGCGIGGRQRLERWARENPELWGNHEGEHMFGLASAYGFWNRDYLSLAHVIAHWRAVADRIEAGDGLTIPPMPA